MIVAVVSAAAILAFSIIMVRRNGPLWSAPFLAGVFVLLGIAVGGALVFPDIRQFGPTYLAYKTSVEDPLRAVAFFLLGSATFLLGGLVTMGRAATSTRFAVPDSERLRRTVATYALVIGWLGILLAVVGFGGPSAVVERPGYLQYSGPVIAVSISNALIPVSCGGLGFTMALPEAKGRRWLILLTVAVAMVLSFSAGSRRLGVIPVLFFIGWTVAAPTRRKLLLGVPVLGVVTLFLSGLAIRLRLLPTAGLQPYAQYLFTRQGAVPTSLESALANVLAPFAYNSLSARNQGLPVRTYDIISSLSPLPSAFIHYNPNQLQFFARHPYPALGTLNNFGGYTAVAVFMLASGAVVGAAVRAVRTLSGRASAIGAILLLALSVYFTVRLTSYSLRTAGRLMWYLAFATAVYRLIYLPNVLKAQVREQTRRAVQSVKASSAAQAARQQRRQARTPLPAPLSVPASTPNSAAERERVPAGG